MRVSSSTNARIAMKYLDRSLGIVVFTARTELKNARPNKMESLAVKYTTTTFTVPHLYLIILIY